MLNMSYKGDNTVYPINFMLVSDAIVELKGDFPARTDGFTLSRPGHDDDKWDYSGYTTVFRETEDGVQFSCDGSVYIPPEEPGILDADGSLPGQGLPDDIA